MKKTRQHGFSAVEIILAVVVVVAIAALGWYVYSANQNNTTANQTSNSSQGTSQTSATQYLTISEWGVKIPLTDQTKTATYRYENGYVYLDVKLTSDPNASACNSQAAVERISVNDIREDSDSSQMIPASVAGSSKIGDYYYRITGSQSMCSEDTALQSAALGVRNAWIAQGKNIVAQ